MQRPIHGVHPIFLQKYFGTLMDHCASSNLCFSANLPPFRADITRQKTAFDKFYSLQNHTLHSAKKANAATLAVHSNTAQSCVMLVSCSVEKTSPKGFSASKCDIGNWIFSKLGIFEKLFGIFLDFWEEFFETFWGIFLESLKKILYQICSPV